MKKYKLSKYNIFRKFDENTVVACNLIDKVFFGIDIEKYNLLINNTSDFNIVQKKNPNFFSAMLKLGIIIDAEIDEMNRIILIHREQIYNNPMYRITVMPTLDCNFNCWYCYEEHSKDRMSSSVQKAILKHVRQVLDGNNLKLLSLDWFGGEPLLYFNDVVYSLSSKIKRECEKHSISFTNSITTNGALITKLA